MSKTISGSLAAHFAQDSRTVATLMKITREDATVYGFSNHDKTLTFSGVDYVPLNGFNPTAVATTSGMNVDNLDIVALIDSGVISDDEFSAGLFDFATIEVMQVNWADLSMGSLTIRYGNLGEVSLKNSTGAWQGELRGLMQRLQQSIGRLGGKRCDADLGDARCTVNIAALTQTGTVTSVGSRSNLEASGLVGATSLFNGGLLTWLTGANAGLAMEVKRWLATSPQGMIDLNLPMPYNISAGDTFTVYPGCDKNLSTCRDTFNNVNNFRGFPTIPGRDRVLQYPELADMISKDDIVAEARKWIGTPFREKGRTRGKGCDCVGLLIGVMRDLGIEYHEVTHYSTLTPNPVHMRRELEAQLDPIPPADAVIGDIYHMLWVRYPMHVGIITGVGIIHCWSGVGKVVEHPLDVAWRGRVRGAYRFRGVV